MAAKSNPDHWTCSVCGEEWLHGRTWPEMISYFMIGKDRWGRDILKMKCRGCDTVFDFAVIRNTLLKVMEKKRNK